MNYYSKIHVIILLILIGCNKTENLTNDRLTRFDDHKVDYIQDPLSNIEAAPKLAIIPVGINRLGTDDKDRPENERPSYLVNIKESFALGVYEVTFDEYDLYCQDTGRPRPSDEGWGRGQRPVINITWYDAKFYVDWLSEQTGEEYFLPSEAQWEYAARSGTTTNYWWGDDPGDKKAQCAGCAKIHRCLDCQNVPLLEDGTVNVGSFKPNVFGLYDVHGNVGEFTADCEIKSNPDFVSDGRPRLNGDCDRHIIKDGSWWRNINFIKASVRGGAIDGKTFRSQQIGFRVARKIRS